MIPPKTKFDHTPRGHINQLYIDRNDDEIKYDRH